MTEQTTERAARTPAPRKPLRVVNGTGGGSPQDRETLVHIPGTDAVYLDLEADRLVKRKGDKPTVFLDWAPRLLAWWTDAENVPVYRVSVREQEGYLAPETLRDGTAWDQFDHAAGHDVRNVREALAGAVKVQRRTIPKAPGLGILGWHEINGEWVYVSADRCFGPAGEVDVNVNTTADESALPPAPTGDRLRDVVALSLSVLDAAVMRVSAPAMCAAWLAPLLSLFGSQNLPRFVPWMWSDGQARVFGVFKSSFAAIVQAHSGAGYRGESDLLPAADITVPALATFLGERKDGLGILDDYKRGETASVSNKTQGTMESALRLGTNRQPRKLRKHRGPGLAKTLACMALLFVTAECLPLFDSGSTHDRTFPFQVHKGDIDAAKLTVLQDRIEDFPEAGSAYVQWLAANHGQVTTFLTNRFRELRTELRNGERVTGRACSHVAHLLCAAEVFTRFAVETGVLTEDRRVVLFQQIEAALIEAATATVTELAEDQPHEVWLRELRTLFSTGRLYAATAGTSPGGAPGEYTEALGWTSERKDAPAGYALPEGLAVVETLFDAELKKLGKGLSVGGVNLRRLLAAKNIIRPVQWGDGKHEHLHRVTVGRARPWYPIVPWEVFFGTEDGTPQAPQGGQDGQGGPAAPEGPQDPGTAPEAPLCRGCGGPLDVKAPDPSGYHPGCDPEVNTRPASVAEELPEPAPEPEPEPEPAPASRPQARRAPRTARSIADRVAAALEAAGGDTDAATAALIKQAIPDSVELLEEVRTTGRYEFTAHPPTEPEILRKRGRQANQIWEARPNWTNKTVPAGTEVDRLDTNAAYLSALNTHLPIGTLVHQEGPEFNRRRSGAYRITPPEWTHTDLPNPLGNREEAGPLWVTRPTLQLLCDLATEKYGSLCAPPVVHESWTSGSSESLLRQFRDMLRDARAEAIATGDTVTLEYIKPMYSKFVSTMIKESRFNHWIERSDWPHIIRAQAHGNLWRKALKAHQAGLTVYKAVGTDELHVVGDWRQVWAEGRGLSEMKLKDVDGDGGTYRVGE